MDFGAGGQSASWRQQKQRVVDIFDENFRLACEKYTVLAPRPWSAMPVGKVINKQLWEAFAGFLVGECLIPEGNKNAGEHLSMSTALNYFNSLLNQARERFEATGSPEVKLFFRCVDTKSSSPEAAWLNGIKKNIRRICFERAKAAGEEMDKSESARYAPPSHTRALRPHITPTWQSAPTQFLCTGATF